MKFGKNQYEIKKKNCILTLSLFKKELTFIQVVTLRALIKAARPRGFILIYFQ